MKFKFLTIILLFCYLSNTYSQIKPNKITYKVSFKNKEKSDSEKVNKFITYTTNQFKNINVELITNGSEANFINVEALTLNEKDYSFYKMALAISGLSGRTWYMTKSDVIEKYEFKGQDFNIKNKSIQWNLLKETKTIKNFTAYKAICKKNIIGSRGVTTRTYEVWYTPEVPIKFGPLGLVGLPGLILEIKFNKVTYKVDKINLNPPKVKIKKILKNYIEQNEFLKLADKKVNEFNIEIGRE